MITLVSEANPALPNRMIDSAITIDICFHYSSVLLALMADGGRLLMGGRAVPGRPSSDKDEN
jgi:hypothetical protein